MLLKYKDAAGAEVYTQVSSKPIVIGRAADNDIVLYDERSSRKHCEIRLWGGDYVLKDISSHNGTYLNGERVQIAVLRPGDEIRIGGSKIMFVEKQGIGPETALEEIQEEMEDGKGYRTILRRIVKDMDGNEPEVQPPSPPSTA